MSYNLTTTALALITVSLLRWSLKAWWSRRDVLKDIPMPTGASLIWGHERTIAQQPIGKWYGDWFERIGATYKIKAAGVDKDILVTVDPGAIHQIYTRNTYNYEHSSVFRPLIKRILGEGLVWVEGRAEHRRMRSLVSPAFSLERVRTFAPIIWATATSIQAKLEKLIHDQSASGSSQTVIDLTKWTAAGTLDVIGKVALGFDFQLGEAPEAKSISRAWSDQVNAGLKQSTFFGMVILKTFPWITSLPVAAIQAQGEIKTTVEALAHQLLESAGDELEHNEDLLSMLYTAQRNTEQGKNVSPHEVIEHISTFTMVGHETVAGVLAFTLHALAQNVDAQKLLREEISTMPGEPAFETLWSEERYPVLEAVIREGCRLFSIAGYTEKVCQSDDVLPLKFPIPSADGKTTIDKIHVKKGQVIHVPLICADQLPQVWGPTAHEFRPERWMQPGNVPNADMRTGGWSNIYVFGEGPRMCVGWRLALAELKVFLITFVRHFRFHDTGAPIAAQFCSTMQPYVLGKESEGIQLPVGVTLI